MAARTTKRKTVAKKVAKQVARKVAKQAVRKPVKKAAKKAAKKVPKKAPTPKLPPEWQLLIPLLETSLSRLKRKQFLVLACTDAHRFVQFACGGPGKFRGEVVSNHFLDEDDQLAPREVSAIKALGWSAPTYADDAAPEDQDEDGSPNWYRDFTGFTAVGDAARAAAATLFGAFRHLPAQVRYHAFAAEGEEIALPLSGIQPEEEWLSPGFRPDDLEELKEMVLDTLKGTELGTLSTGDGADAIVQVGERQVYVAAHDEPMSVLCYSVIGELDESPDGLAMVNELNRSRNGCRAILYEGHLLVDRVLPADPFVPRQLVETLIELVAWGNSIAGVNDPEPSDETGDVVN